MIWPRSLALFTLAAALFAQAPGPPAAQLAEMKKLEFLVGQWQGAGWMEFGPGQRREFTGTENIETKAGGVALLVQGLHKSGGATVHDTLAVLSWDPQSKTYRLRSYTAAGQYHDAEVRLTDAGLVWGFEERGMQFRFTIAAHKDEWLETGDASRDGFTWRKFFEMKLARVSR